MDTEFLSSSKPLYVALGVVFALWLGSWLLFLPATDPGPHPDDIMMRESEVVQPIEE